MDPKRLDRVIPVVPLVVLFAVSCASSSSNSNEGDVVDGGGGSSGSSGGSVSGSSSGSGSGASSGAGSTGSSSSGGVGSTSSSSGNGSGSGGGTGSASGSSSGGLGDGSASDGSSGDSGDASKGGSSNDAPSGATCTTPIWSSGEATGTDSLDSSGTWWVDNDAWSGSHGPQTINVCSKSSWYAVSNQTNNGGAVETYPNTEYDVGGRNNGLSTKTIAQYKSITSTFSEAFPSAGSWDAAYDLWLNNWGTEIMIWNEWTGTQLYWPPSGAKAVTLDGVAYHFYNNGGELMFFRDAMVKSGSVDILAAMNWLVSQGLVKSTDVPTQLEYGVEICATPGSETFPMTGLTFSLD